MRTDRWALEDGDSRSEFQPDFDRNPFQHDRDRVLYSPEFRRLANVTQVVGTRETQAFHNRLTHSLKVAQVGRRLAERLIKKYDTSLLDKLGLDADVVEAACLAHDLGHPPFGHLAEEELNEILEKQSEGFEGNAQSFRILTKLSFRRRKPPGLNLTRATLNATLKYPRLRSHERERKWGSYRSEKSIFDWVRRPSQRNLPTLEAKIMDWADDITYAIHDLEDFFRAGLIPLEQLRRDSSITRGFVEDASSFVSRELGRDKTQFENAFARLQPSFPTAHFSGSRLDTITLHGWASGQIRTYIHSAEIVADQLVVPAEANDQVMVLKQMTWHFVINGPSLATLQQGQRETIRGLYSRLNTWAKSAWGKDREIAKLPRGLREYLVATSADKDAQEVALNQDQLTSRAVVDYIASLTEEQAVSLFQRLTGGRALSALEPWLHR